jgi:Calcineurin-like phosphoesterase
MTDGPAKPSAGDTPPPRPTTEKASELGFERRKRMVRWLSPTQLFRTGRQALFAVLIEGYSDKREIQAALPSPGIFDDLSTDPEVWIDFVSDLGDGFNPTYALASLLARPSLSLRDETRRGQILVMGGDEVYPAATQRRYRDRLVGPYRAALPYLAENQPDLFVVPGNHDWFDGLTSFMRVFCQRGWVGAWRTSQTRSYFAIELPHKWWLWGLDIQFDNYIDWPQFSYFKAEVAKRVTSGDGIILCVAKPSWVDANVAEPTLDPDLYTTLDFFQQHVIPPDASVRLAISGDRHHYARYEEREGTRQLITCGGGGAFLSETHGLPDEITVPHPKSSDPSPSRRRTYDLKAAYPVREGSRQRAWARAWSLLWLNDAFPILVGAVAALLTYMGRAGLESGGQPFWGVADRWWRSTLTILLLVGLAVGLVRFTKTRGLLAWALGLGHFVLHVMGIITAGWAASRIFSGVGGAWHVAWTLVGTFVLYGLVGTVLFTLYLLVADLFRVNRTELFASMRIEGMKSFLRIRIDEAGCTIYPVRVEKVPRRWQLEPTGGVSDPWFTPVGGDPVPELIETPIFVPREG